MKSKYTPSQRKQVTARPRRKWYDVTVARMNDDGTMTAQTYTASTGKKHETVDISRRGKVTATA